VTRFDFARNAAAALCTLVASATLLAAAVAPAQQGARQATVAAARLSA